MNGKDLDGIFDKMGNLAVDQSEGAIKPSYNEFINELNYDYGHVGP
jgi:hypothetical protein